MHDKWNPNIQNVDGAVGGFSELLLAMRVASIGKLFHTVFLRTHRPTFGTL